MSRNVYRMTHLTFMVFLVLGFMTACDQNVEITPLATPPPPTQSSAYTIRVELVSTTVWADVRITNPQDVLSADLVSVSGNPIGREASTEGQGIDQSTSAVRDGNEVGITVDYMVKAERNEDDLNFRLQRHALNGCIVRVFHIVGEETQLIYELDHNNEIYTDPQKTLDFTLDLNAMTVASTEGSPQTPLPPAEAASIIFHNGQVITMDANMTQAEAIAIQDDIILAVGGDEDIMSYQEEDTIIIDLQGKTLLPGFIDGHTHILIFPDRMGRTMDDAMEIALRLGFTSVTEMVGEADFIEELQRAEQEGRMRLRVNVFTNVNKGYLDGADNILVDNSWSFTHAPILDHDLRVRVPGIKIFVDGAGVPGRGCPAMREPYPLEAQSADWFINTCFSEYGELYWEQAELNQVVAAAQAAGYRAAFHAMGDKGIEAALDAIEYALDGEPNEDHRHQIQHSSVLEEDLIDRYQSLDILSSLRGFFPTCYQDDPVSGNRYALPGLGVHAYLETDFGWTVDPDNKYAIRNPNAMMALHSLVTHKQILEDGTICNPEPWLVQRVITVEQALRIMTTEPAYAVSQEDYLGSLKPGKFADMIILSDNPLTIDPDDLKDLEVWMTMVGGQTEYCAPGQEAYCPNN